jgi:hypothetical protein
MRPVPEFMERSLDRKLAAIHADPHGCGEFIIADAKDADMGFGVTAPGPEREQCPHGFDPGQGCFKTLAQYRGQIREVVRQELVDIVLLSASNLEQLAMRERIFDNTAITPAGRANDTSDVWVVRGGKYIRLPSRPFRSATIDHIKYGRIDADHSQPVPGAELGLYSVTFTNDLDTDYKALQDFQDFRIEAERKRFRYFLEVFNPNVDAGLERKKIGAFLNDCIIRTLAGVTSAGRPLFLKIPYNGPGPLEELASYDPHLVVGRPRRQCGDDAGRLQADPRCAQARGAGGVVRAEDQSIRESAPVHSVPACDRGRADRSQGGGEGVS